MEDEKVASLGENIPVEILESIENQVLESFQMSVPWMYGAPSSAYGSGVVDEDNFKVRLTEDVKEIDNYSRSVLQQECWNKFQRNPYINTTVRGQVGRLTGLGFETTSEIWEIQEVIEEIELDWRNRLYNFWPKYVGRHGIEGELFLTFTLHLDGFVEIDFVDPSRVDGGGDDDSGILFHPDKPTMPLFYNISRNGTITDQIPSIFVAKWPELRYLVSKHKDFEPKLQQKSRSRKHKYRKLGGYYRFIVAWEKGFVVRRAVSHLRTILEWLNHYELLKQFEIDHKRSAGAYLWVFKITDARAFKIWLKMSDEDKRKTVIVAKKTPGSSVVLPPGMELDVINSNLPAIKDEDTDIREMVGAGLNEPEDIMTNTSKGTFASVNATRGPMTDRTSDEIAYFDRFLKYDFWSAIFFLRSSVTDFPKTFKIEKAVSWGKDQEPVWKKVPRKPEQLIDVSYPVSEVINFESRAKGLLGVKHGPISETLGIPNAEVAKRMGFGGYGRQRLRKEEEVKKYPELVYEMGVDAESIQETAEGEPGKPAKKVKPKTEPKKATK